MGVMTKMLCGFKSGEAVEYIVAVDGLIEESMELSCGSALEMEKMTFKGKEEKAVFLQLKKKAEKLEDLQHANKRNENLTKIQAGNGATIEAKGQRIKALSGKDSIAS